MPSELLKSLGELKDELENLKTAAEEIKNAGKFATESADISKKTIDIANKLAEPTQKLVDKIDKVDFPIRLDKLDVAITSINSGMNTIIQRTDSIEKEIKDRIEIKNNEMKEYFLKLIEEQNSQIKLLKILLIISIIMIIVGVILQFVK